MSQEVTVLAGTNPTCRDTAQTLTVDDKKEVFYRFMRPLIVLAIELVPEQQRTERGEEYVETLKSIIRVNGRDSADGADIERRRDTGELARTVRRMRLE